MIGNIMKWEALSSGKHDLVIEDGLNHVGDVVLLHLLIHKIHKEKKMEKHYGNHYEMEMGNIMKASV